MNRIPLNSKLIAAVSYDRLSSRLVVELLDGKIIAFANVPEEIFRNLLSAASPGSYYRHHLQERGSRPHGRSTN